MKILIVDDDPMIRQMLRRQLVGHEIREAEGYSSALYAANKERFDLVISDVQMGADGTGFDLARALRAFVDAPKVVLCSGARWPAEAAAECGALVCLLKPVAVSDILQYAGA